MIPKVRYVDDSEWKYLRYAVLNAIENGGKYETHKWKIRRLFPRSNVFYMNDKNADRKFLARVEHAGDEDKNNKYVFREIVR